MKTVQIQVTEDHLTECFEKYDKLGKIQKKILNRLIWHCKKYPTAFPNQEMVGEKIPCSRKHVNRTIALFKSYGWLWLESRGRNQSKIIHMQKWLLAVDFVNREWFRRVEVTSKVTHSYSKESKNTGRKKTSDFKKLEIASWLQKKEISLDAKLKLSLVSEFSFQEAYHQCKVKAKHGFMPDDQEKYFVGTAINIAQKRGEKLNWRSYYACFQ